MQTGRESVSGVQETESVEERELISETIEEVDTNESDTSNENSPPESVRETVAKALEEIRKGEPDSEEEKPENQNVRDSSKARAKEPNVPGIKDKSKKPSAIKAPGPEDVVAPARLSASEKEIFNSLPQGLKPSIARMYKEFDQRRTQFEMEHAKAMNENRGIMEAVQPYVAEWGERNLTVPQAIAGLAAAHRKLLDPDTAPQKWAEIGVSIGVDPERLKAFMDGEKLSYSGKSQSSSRSAPDSEVSRLQARLDAIESRNKQAEDAELNRITAPVIAEGQAVKNEVDSAGRYLYPELHDEATVNERIRPLVSALVTALPDLSYGDALRRAVHTLRGQNGNLNPLNQTRPTGGDPNTINRAQSAAISVRGRSAPVSNGIQIPANVPSDVHSTVRMALEHLRRGA